MLPTIGKEAVKGELIDATALSVSRRARAEIRAHLVLAGARVADPIARRGQAGAGFGVPDRRGRNAAGARAEAGRVDGGAVSPYRSRRRPGPDRVWQGRRPTTQRTDTPDGHRLRNTAIRRRHARGKT